MTRAKVQDALDWLDHQITHPTQSWQGLCMSSARQAWGQPPWAASANKAWARVPLKYRHYTAVKDVPAGAVCFGLFNHTFGHAWIAGRGRGDKRIGFSVDYRRKGFIDRAPLSLPAWTHDQKVHWTAWSPTGFLPLWKDARNAKYVPMPKVYRGTHAAP